MNGMNNDQVMLFDNRKKLNIPDCAETSLDGIGSHLLGQEFLKVPDDNALNSNDRVLATSSSFADQLLIINNDLNDQQPISLDDVVDLDLSSLSQTLENNGLGQQLPQEPLGFTDFLSESSFCLNGLSEKLGDVPDKLSFGSFISDSACDDVLKNCGKGYKIVPHFVDGKITNTIHLTPIHGGSEDTLANGAIASEIFHQAAAPLPACSTSDRITASIDDFPTLANIGSGIPLNGNLPVVVETNGVDPEISDLITVKPKEPVAKSSESKTKLKEKKTTKRKLKNNEAKPPAKQKKKKKKAQPPADLVEPVNSIPNVIPKFKIVQKPNDVGPSVPPEPSVKPQTMSASQFVAIPTSSFIETPESESASVIEPLTAKASSSQEPIELILPVVSVPGKGNSKPVLKPISELQPEDVCTVRRDPLKKLSKIQLQQIVNFLRQKKVMKSSPSDPETNGRSKIVCRIMYPDEFQKKCENDKTTKSSKDESSSKKTDEGSSRKEDEPTSKSKKSKARVQEVQEEEYVPQLQIAPSVTRSGRTSRPPKQLLKSSAKPASANGKMDETSDPSKESSRIGADGKEEPEKQKPVLLSLPPREKKKVNNFVVCPTCGKKYIGRTSFQKHLEQFPDHGANVAPPPPPVEGDCSKPVPSKKRTCKCKCKVPTRCRARRFSLKQMVDSADDKEFVKACAARFAKSTSIWDFVVMRVKTIFKFEEAVKGLIGELGKLVDSLRSTSNKILYPSNQPCENCVEIQDDTISNIMGVSKGTYQTYPSGLEAAKPSYQSDLFFEKEPAPNIPSEFDMVHPDTKEDISQSSLLSDILCDKSGMESVDQLVSERLKTLAPGDDILMDPPSDDLMTSLLNSVHSGSLSDSIFNPRVSGSTEDLLKALETLSNEIQPNPPPLDFSALSTEFSTPESVALVLPHGYLRKTGTTLDKAKAV
ncbi:hypothetical protein GE061_018713 [Apolygus lucorum]|uniref:Uncharacterized protein n=1 Tax=Apolygus lucorum TaxID=248454 RepID=A0A6A4JFV2_APOLU|nr:hypothetical protein GE061_018713 [Apolygus lucorum]